MKKRIWVGVLIVSSGMILSACDKKKSDTESSSATQQKTEIQGSAPASSPAPTAIPPLTAKVEKAHYTLPACQGDQCPKVDIHHLETNNPWVNQFLDHQVLKFSQGFSEKPSDRTSLQQNIYAFVKVSNEDAQDGGLGVPYTMSINAEDIGQRGTNLAQFKVSGDYYTGGAHGSAVNSYFVLDLAQHKQLRLDDLVIKGQKQKLYAVVYAEFTRWVKTGDPTANLKEYESMWKFKLTHNFALNKNGLTFYYGQYEIGPYVVGMPEFTIPYAKLSGIIKPEYL